MQKPVTILILILTLALSALACNLPILGSQPAGTPAPTDSGFQVPTLPAETAAAGETLEVVDPAAVETEPAELPPAAGEAPVEDDEITIATTDALQNSGLLTRIVDGFMAKTGYKVKLELGGAGRAFRLGEKFVADVLLINDPDDEIEYLKAGHGKDRILVMHSDYLIVGPAEDPAGVKTATDAVDAFRKIAGASEVFVTREAEAPVIRLERDLWRQAGITPTGAWYTIATDAGPVGVLKLAFDKKGYTLIDRATYLAKKGEFTLEILYQGDVELYDAYHVITHDPAKSPKINAAASQAFVDYLLSPEVQSIIEQHGVDTYGLPLFFPDAGRTE
jgi:tungstate transport system substrate-binding protein